MRCQRLCFLQNGKVVGCDTPENIRKAFPFKVFSVKSADKFRLLGDLRNFPACHACYPFGAYHHFYYKEGTIRMEELESYLASLQHEEIKIKESEPTIEDCFMELIRSSGTSRRWTISASRSRKGKSSGSSAPTEQARPQPSVCSAACTGPLRAAAWWRASTLPRNRRTSSGISAT